MTCFTVYPGGVVDVDLGVVVASRAAARDKVLPQEACLTRLEQSGTLSQNQSGQIRSPAELNGAHAVKFLLLRAAPKPEGDNDRDGTLNVGGVGPDHLTTTAAGKLWLSKGSVQDEREPDTGFAQL